MSSDSVCQEPEAAMAMAAGVGVRRASAAVVARRFAVVAALIALDLWSKAAVFGWLGGIESQLAIDDHGHARYPLIGEWLTFMLSLNPGAAFGKLADFPHFLVAGRATAALVLAFLIVRAPLGRRIVNLAFILILAGALGNLYDNLFLNPDGSHPYGQVRDFIDVFFGVWDWHFPTFNVADSCITVGAVLLLGSGLFGAEDSPRSARPAARAGAQPGERS